MAKSYLLKITLLDIKPPVWRRFVVPADIKLNELHDVIQMVMGWSGGCFHLFMMGKNRYTHSFDVDPEFGDIPEEKFALKNVLPQKGKIKYLYDITGNWMHEIEVENMNYMNLDSDQTIICLEGERACPPNDCCIGFGDYEYFCQVITDPAHEEHETLVKRYDKYYDDSFDPERFNIDEVNQFLQKISTHRTR